MNSGLDDKFVHSLVQDPAQPEVIFALTDSSGLFKVDINSGAGWTKVGLGLPLLRVHLPAYSEEHPFATHAMQDWNSSPESTLLTDNGWINWSPPGLGGETIPSLAVDQTDADLVYAATDTPGSLKISLDSVPVTFYSLATSPSTPGILYASTSNGLYTYEAGCWTQLGLEDHAVTALAVYPSHPSRIYTGTSDNGAYISNDAGLSWDVVDRNLSAITIQSIQIDPNTTNYIYLNTKTHGVFLSNRFP